ncbi:nucleoside triphosphate pyrophosphohydrolase [Halorubrum salinarum]|uniref:Nucleoside triphosphate pyrophosphohydrolase n=1 Tax=Halorubrum salinarum TaxID=2739057 RepID=A0A7D4C770_9EURY|nr:nucleoside triphosphate pyrophosphohydrolase [Halorubrum salinarum]QKG93878.1 nucleoside triphosphate pyrophosphohydrolase [Halorubrum salinarum]
MAEEYDKLVRDEIPEIIEADGGRAQTHVAGEDEYADRLAAKLAEETAEYRESRDPRELADVLEVVHALRELNGLTPEELAELRAEKAERRGRFDERIVLERVEE